MDLFIANTTKQHHDFFCRIPEHSQLYRDTIKAGGQIKISKLDQQQIDAIIDQHARYGMQDARKVDRKTFVGLMYSTGRPVDAGQIEEGLNDNDQAMTDKASDLRAASIAASQQALAEQAEAMGGDAGKISVEIVEQKNPNNPESDPSFAQRIEVDETTDRAIKTGKRK